LHRAAGSAHLRRGRQQDMVVFIIPAVLLLLLPEAFAWTPTLGLHTRYTRSTHGCRARVCAGNWFGTHAEKFANEALALWSQDALEQSTLWSREEEYHHQEVPPMPQAQPVKEREREDWLPLLFDTDEVHAEKPKYLTARKPTRRPTSVIRRSFYKGMGI